MSLLAYNLTTAPLALVAGNPIATLPAASSAGAHGPAVNVTSELKNLTDLQYDALMAQALADEVVFIWSNGPNAEEYQTGPLEVGFENHDYYVVIGGNDLNPGTLAQPFATLDQAFDAISALGTHRGRLRINMGLGLFTPQSGRQYQLSRMSGHRATPLFIMGTPTDELGTIVASAGDVNATMVTIAGAVPGVADDYFGFTIKCISGANAGMSRQIVANTAGAGPNTFTLNEQFYFGPVSIGDEFIVQKYGSVIQPTPGALFNLTQVLVGMRYIKYQNRNFAFFGSALFTSSCEFALNGRGFINAFGAEWFAAAASNPWAYEGANNPLGDGTDFPAGPYLHGGNYNQTGDSFIADAYMCLKDMVCQARRGTKSILFAVSAKNSTWSNADNANLSHDGPFNLDGNTFLPRADLGPAKWDGDAGIAGRGQIYLFNGSEAILNGMEFVNASADAIVVENGVVTLGITDDTPGTGTFRPWVIGASAAGVGVAARQISGATYKLFNAANGATAATAAANTITGLTGAGLDAALNVGDMLELSGFANAGNNGIFKIASVISPTSCTIVNGAFVTPDANDGAGVWTLFNAPHLSGVGGDIRLGGRLDSVGASVGGTVVTIADACAVTPNGERGIVDVPGTGGNDATAIEFSTLYEP